MNIKDYLEKVKSKQISVVDTISSIIKEAKKINKEYHYFNAFSETAIEEAKKIEKNPRGKLAGLPISVKDNICVKNLESTAGSKILQGYKPLFNATVIQNLINEGAIVIGKTAQDEFGFGSFSTNVGIGFEMPKNPIDKTRVTGGSSGGAAGFTQITSYPHVAIAESTGGSIVAPASFCGVIGLCPTYGLVSRYGLIDYANSLDKIGPITKTIDDAKLALEIMASHDSKDSTSLSNKQIIKQPKKMAVIKESLNVDPEIKDSILKFLDGKKYDTISLPLTEKYSVSSYYLIAMAETSTNLAKYCGLRYGLHEKLDGNFNEYFSKVRSLALGKEAKRRIILGTFARMAGFRDAYYLKALKIRTLIIEEYKKAFKKYDLLISPTMPIIAPKLSEITKLTPLQNYMLDTLTTGPNLAGLPHLTIPSNEDKMPIGIMFIGNHFSDNMVLDYCNKL